MSSRQFFLISLFFPFLLLSEVISNTPKEKPTVLLAVLARNKAHILPTYLDCIDHLDYDKKRISVYINTNNNVDNTEVILKNWIKEHQNEYASVEIEVQNVNDSDSNRPHEWNAKRFGILALIRNKSMKKALEKQTDFYFVVDCDNFIAPNTLSYLVSKNKPIIAPLLKAIPEPGDLYSNYFCAVSSTGYFESHPDYFEFLSETKKGTFEVPLVHCTYLIQRNVIPLLSYIDGTEDYEFVIFSREARKNQISQFICNEHPFGSLLHFTTDISLSDEKARFEEVISSKLDLLNPNTMPACEDVFSNIYKNKIWGENAKGEGYSGQGSSLEHTVKYREFLKKFLDDYQIKSVVDVGCGDWTFSQAIDWSGIEYRGLDVVEEVIKKNNQLFGSPSIHFELVDGTKENTLPPADLLLCKEVLQHLPFSDVKSFLKNLDQYKYCLITNDINPFDSTTLNCDIERGGYRYLDLTEPPFSLKAEKILTYPAPPFLKQVLLIKHSEKK